MPMQIQDSTQNGNVDGVRNSSQNSGTDYKLKHISPEMLSAALDSFPEMSLIGDLLDKKCYILHEDSESKSFSSLFKQILCTNKDVFSNLTTQEKANTLFKFHSDIIFHKVFSSNEYKILFNQIFSQIEKPYQKPHVKKSMKLCIENKLRRHMERLHTCFLEFAISTTLNAPIDDLSFSAICEKAEQPKLRTPLDMSIYEKI